MPQPTGESIMVQEALKILRDTLRSEPGSLQEQADRLGVHKATVGRILQGAYTPSPQMIEQLLDALGYSVEVVVSRR